MSNPAVITLSNASSKKGKFKRFVIEDNIGESMHLHIDNMRIDFTIKEFLEFSKMIKESLIELDFLGKYSIDDFDEHFLQECGSFLYKLERIEVEEIKLSKVKSIVNSRYKSDLSLVKLVSISDTPAYKYLQGDIKDFLDYEQFNYFGIDNEKRLLDTLDSIKINSYPLDNKYLILFNGQDIIRDGQHRAAILAHLYGLNSTVKIMRFYFNDEKHFVKVNQSNLKKGSIWFSRKVYRKLKRYMKK